MDDASKDKVINLESWLNVVRTVIAGLETIKTALGNEIVVMQSIISGLTTIISELDLFINELYYIISFIDKKVQNNETSLFLQFLAVIDAVRNIFFHMQIIKHSIMYVNIHVSMEENAEAFRTIISALEIVIDENAKAFQTIISALEIVNKNDAKALQTIISPKEVKNIISALEKLITTLQVFESGLKSAEAVQASAVANASHSIPIQDGNSVVATFDENNSRALVRYYLKNFNKLKNENGDFLEKTFLELEQNVDDELEKLDQEEQKLDQEEQKLTRSMLTEIKKLNISDRYVNIYQIIKDILDYPAKKITTRYPQFIKRMNQFWIKKYSNTTSRNVETIDDFDISKKDREETLC